MKLHFYTLETGYNSQSTSVIYKECEVEEKPKTFKSVSGILPNYTHTFSKDDIGKISGNYTKRVVLLEKDDNLALSIFKKYLHTCIESAKEALRREEKKLSGLEENGVKSE